MSSNSILLGLASTLLAVSFCPAVQADTRMLDPRSEVARPGRPVSHDFTDDLGNVVRVTLTPPKDRAVDPRLFTEADIQVVGFEVDTETKDLDMSRLPPLPSSEKKNQQQQGEPIDLSGYVVTLDLVSAASCSVAGYWVPSSTSLAAGSWYTVQTASGADVITISAYPTSGDVDVYTYYGSTQCGKSTNSSGKMDTHTCYSSSCSNTSTYYSKVKNYSTSSTAKFVASSVAVWVN